MTTSDRHEPNEPVESSDRRDRGLLIDIAAGDRAAMADFYGSYFPRLFKFLHRLSYDYELTEELVNDVMMIVWRSAGNFRGKSKVSTWVLGIAYRQCMKKLRKGRIKLVEMQSRYEVQVDDRHAIESQDLISKAMKMLTPEHRLVIEFVLYLGMTYQEVAEVVGCPVNTAKTRVHNARKRLRVILGDMGYRYGDHSERT